MYIGDYREIIDNWEYMIEIQFIKRIRYSDFLISPSCSKDREPELSITYRLHRNGPDLTLTINQSRIDGTMRYVLEQSIKDNLVQLFNLIEDSVEMTIDEFTDGTMTHPSDVL